MFARWLAIRSTALTHCSRNVQQVQQRSISVQNVRGIARDQRWRPIRRGAAHHVRDLREALKGHSQNATWQAYVKLVNAGKLEGFLSEENHSQVLRSFKLGGREFGQQEVDVTTRRIEYVLQNMRAVGYQLDIRDYNHLLDFYGRTGQWEACIKVWDEMQSKVNLDSIEGIVPDTFTYNTLMNAAITCGRPQYALEFYDQMKKNSVRPNSFTFHKLMDAYGLMGDVHAVERVFNIQFTNKRQTQSPEPAKPSRLSRLVAPFKLEQSPSLSSNASSAAQRLTLSNDNKLGPSPYTFSSLIDAYGRAGDMAKIYNIHREMMPEYGVQPDLKVYNQLMYWYNKAGDTESAQALVSEMNRAGVEPDALTFKYLLHREEIQSNPEKAEQLLQLMKDVYNLQPLRSMYRDIIRAYNKLEQGDHANRLFQEYLTLTRAK